MWLRINLNDDPIANDDFDSGFYNEFITGQLLNNDSDPDGDPLTVNTVPVVAPNNGTVVINADGTYTYTPDNDFAGDDSFTYEVCDDQGGCEVATVFLSVANLPATAVNDLFNADGVPINGNVIANDFDPDTDDELTIVSVNGQGIGNGPITSPLGSILMNPDGTFVFTPTRETFGTAEFTYTHCG